MLHTVPLSCLSVTLAYYVQTVAWIKMPLGTEVGLGTGDNVLDGDPAESGTAAPTFQLMSIFDHVYYGQAVDHLSNC